jgi:hypothetical protein
MQSDVLEERAQLHARKVGQAASTKPKRASCLFHLLFHPEDGGSRFLRNARLLLASWLLHNLRRLKRGEVGSSETSAWSWFLHSYLVYSSMLKIEEVSYSEMSACSRLFGICFGYSSALKLETVGSSETSTCSWLFTSCYLGLFFDHDEENRLLETSVNWYRSTRWHNPGGSFCCRNLGPKTIHALWTSPLGPVTNASGDFVSHAQTSLRDALQRQTSGWKQSISELWQSYFI